MKRSLSRSGGSLILVSGLLVLQAGAGAGAPRDKGTTFAGSCSFEGAVKFEPGATYVERPLHYDFTGKGLCTGNLKGKRVSGIPVRVHQYGPAEGTCASARTTSPGQGKLTFPDGRVLTYTLEFTYTLPETQFSIRGSRSGEANATGTFQTDRSDRQDTLARCATPTGATSVPMDMTLETETPLVSRKS